MSLFGEGTEKMPNSEHEKIVRRWFDEVFTQGDPQAVDKLLADDFISRDPSGEPGAVGVDAFKSWLEWYLSSFTDPEWRLHDILSDGNKAVVRYSGLTTYQGGFLDIPSSKQRVKEMGVLIFRIEDGKVHELWSALSDLEVVLELGGRILA
jgi:steroid delta-isomerase-like uncharacterized protein